MQFQCHKKVLPTAVHVNASQPLDVNYGKINLIKIINDAIRILHNVEYILVFYMFSNKVHDDWPCKVCRIFLKSTELALLGKVLKCLQSFRCCAVDIWRQSMHKCIVNPFAPFSLFPARNGITFV